MSRKSTPERDALISELLEKMRQQLQTSLPDDAATFDQIEDAAGKIGRALSQDVQRRLVEQRSRQPRPPKQDCTCGGLARYKGQQTRTLVTAHGALTYTRACYYCEHCKHTLSPLDTALHLDGGSTTTQVRLWVALLAGQLPFAQAATTLQMLTQVPLSPASVERLSVTIGTALRASEQQQAQQHQANYLPAPPTNAPSGGMWAWTACSCRLRAAYKHDKSLGDLTCRYGECKSGVVYEACQDNAGKDSRVRPHAYIATLDKVDAFGPLLGALAHQHGHHTAQEVVVIGDGAPWIWQIAAKQFTGAVQIVNFFHASEHLAHVAEARFGKDTQEGHDWRHARQEELKSDQLGKVLADLQAWKPTSAVKKQLRQSTYLFSITTRTACATKRFWNKATTLAAAWWKPPANMWWRSD